MTTIVGINPYTGETLEGEAQESSTSEVDALVESATKASAYLNQLGRTGRADLLRTIADNLEARSDELVQISDRETGIGPDRLTGELKRAVFQLRFFSEVLEEGSYIEAAIDSAGDTPLGPRPDLRRMLIPLGPVAVFGASNFPFAFSIAGGDTVSALAAGSPVILKAHDSHPNTSRLSYEIMATAAKEFGAPEGVLGMIYGLKAGAHLVAHPDISAVGFTGSLSGGQALLDIINRRDTPIPFYGELSSLNPFLISAAAAAERSDEIGAGLAASVTTSAGQLCTKPGIVFVPAGEDGDRLVAAFAVGLSEASVSPLLNRRIFESYSEILDTLAAEPGVEQLTSASPSNKSGFHVAPTLYSIEATQLQAHTAQECFGPASLVVRYSSFAELQSALTRVQDALTMTLHVGKDEPAVTTRLTDISLPKAGRIVYNGYPTGVSVSWGQTHGGPWPATNALHTSVGATAIRRFLRPITWQNAPESILPAELRGGSPTVPTRIDGRMTLPEGYGVVSSQ